ncbi:MAG: hydrogenase expression/formation protein HypE [Candidatus Cloacimonadota bacterium]|nr:hydrogenase expression/formation protein HypE [Candidatus Cloacimonadota bacterium]
MDHILLSHGSGGKNSRKLLKFIYDSLGDIVINRGEDSGIAILQTDKLAITTDSYVIDPIFFPGGDIGKLSVCGTLNDLAMVGAIPKYLTLCFIIEENFPFNNLRKILYSIKEEAESAGIKIIAGDTKIVSKGKLDKIFINTTGYGIIEHSQEINSHNAQPGDAVIVTGDIGDHGAAIMAVRNDFESDLTSDCASVVPLIRKLLAENINIHTLRDPTRGGLASILNEIAISSSIDIELEKVKIPIKDSVNGICDILGIDPLYMACEGRAAIICPESEVGDILNILKETNDGKNACKIGNIVDKSKEPRVYLKTFIGARRILPLLSREQTPRIC